MMKRMYITHHIPSKKLDDLLKIRLRPEGGPN